MFNYLVSARLLGDIISHCCNVLISIYPKKPCISCRNLPLKGFSGMGVRIIYYDRFTHLSSTWTG